MEFGIWNLGFGICTDPFQRALPMETACANTKPQIPNSNGGGSNLDFGIWILEFAVSWSGATSVRARLPASRRSPGRRSRRAAGSAGTRLQRFRCTTGYQRTQHLRFASNWTCRRPRQRMRIPASTSALDHGSAGGVLERMVRYWISALLATPE